MLKAKCVYTHIYIYIYIYIYTYRERERASEYGTCTTAKPDSGLGFTVNVLKTFGVGPAALGSAAQRPSRARLEPDLDRF